MLQIQSSWNPLLEKTYFAPVSGKENEDLSVFCVKDDQTENNKEEFYDAYVRKRDARLRARWIERTKKAAEMKHMLDNLVMDWKEMKSNFAGYPDSEAEKDLRSKFKYVRENRKLFQNRSASFSTKDSSSSSSSSSTSANNFLPRSNSKLNDQRATISNQSFTRINSTVYNSNNIMKHEKAVNPQSSLRSTRRSISYGGSKDFAPVISRYSASNSSAIAEDAEFENSVISRTRKKWGRVEQPGILAESRKEAPAKGFKRLLGFAW